MVSLRICRSDMQKDAIPAQPHAETPGAQLAYSRAHFPNSAFEGTEILQAAGLSPWQLRTYIDVAMIEGRAAAISI